MYSCRTAAEGLAQMGIAQVCAGVAVGALVAATAAGVTPMGPHQMDREIALTASTFPIIDIDQTFGPLNLVRQLTAGFDLPSSEQAVATLEAVSKTTLTGPDDFSANLDWTAHLPVTATWSPNNAALLLLSPSLSGGYGLDVGGSSVSASGSISSQLTPSVYLGGGNGYGVGFSGYPVYGTVSTTVDIADIASATVTFGGYLLWVPGANAVVTPSGGLRAALAFVPVSGGTNSTVTMGDTTLSAYASLYTLGNATLCTRSADCGGVIAQSTANVQLFGALNLSRPGDVIATVQISVPDSISVVLKPDRLSITGQIGGTLTVGSTTFGNVVPIDVQIPFPAALPVAAVAPESRTATTSITAATVRAAAAEEATTDEAVIQDGAGQERSTAKPRAGSRESHAAKADTTRQDSGSTGRSARAQR